MVTMSRRNLDREIQLARADILILSSMVVQAMMQSVNALRDHDLECSKTLLENDHHINNKRFSLEGAVITVIATQQPMARDLRVLASILDVCTELERIGDYAKGIAAINLRSGGLGMPKVLQDIHYMAKKTIDMLQRSITTFIDEDHRAAALIVKDDDLIDALYEQLYFEMMDYVVEQPENIESANYVLWVGHNLERMADRVINICVRTVFIETGKMAVKFD